MEEKLDLNLAGLFSSGLVSTIETVAHQTTTAFGAATRESPTDPSVVTLAHQREIAVYRDGNAIARTLLTEYFGELGYTLMLQLVAVARAAAQLKCHVADILLPAEATTRNAGNYGTALQPLFENGPDAVKLANDGDFDNKLQITDPDDGTFTVFLARLPAVAAHYEVMLDWEASIPEEQTDGAVDAPMSPIDLLLYLDHALQQQPVQSIRKLTNILHARYKRLLLSDIKAATETLHGFDVTDHYLAKYRLVRNCLREVCDEDKGLPIDEADEAILRGWENLAQRPKGIRLFGDFALTVVSFCRARAFAKAIKTDRNAVYGFDFGRQTETSGAAAEQVERDFDYNHVVWSENPWLALSTPPLAKHSFVFTNSDSPHAALRHVASFGPLAGPMALTVLRCMVFSPLQSKVARLDEKDWADQPAIAEILGPYDGPPPEDRVDPYADDGGLGALSEDIGKTLLAVFKRLGLLGGSKIWVVLRQDWPDFSARIGDEAAFEKSLSGEIRIGRGIFGSPGLAEYPGLDQAARQRLSGIFAAGAVHLMRLGSLMDEMRRKGNLPAETEQTKQLFDADRVRFAQVYRKIYRPDETKT